MELVKCAWKKTMSRIWTRTVHYYSILCNSSLWPLAGAVANTNIAVNSQIWGRFLFNASFISVNRFLEAHWGVKHRSPSSIPENRSVRSSRDALLKALASWLFSFTFKWETFERRRDWSAWLSITHERGGTFRTAVTDEKISSGAAFVKIWPTEPRNGLKSRIMSDSWGSGVRETLIECV